ncbi:MAG: transglycosylase domain-containing protein [Bdellovibrionota bacterium]
MNSIFAWIRRFRWPIAAAGVAALVVLFFVLRTLSAELEEKFHQDHDSIPTRVYSSVYWIRPGIGASVDELRFRFREREYREVKPGEERSPGTFSLEVDEQKRPTILTVHTNEFAYPAVAKEVIFGNPDAAVSSARFTATWVGGAVNKVLGPDNSELPGGFALEPILVARLNEGNKEARKTVPIAEIPHTLLEGIMLTEDQRFFGHIGFDPRGIARSIWVAIRSGGHAVQGASTITQQLARNMYLNNRRTILRKVEELAVSVFLEIHFTKDEILEKYVNGVFLGQSGNIAIHGVAEAAKFYFNKQLDDLTIAEQALMTGIIKGPPYYSPFRHLDRAKVRQEIVLGKMRDAGVITEAQYNAALNEPIHLARTSAIQNRAPYFTDMVQAQLLKELPDTESMEAGYTIFSTLDTYYQQLAEASVANGVSRVEANIKKYVELEAKRKEKKKKKKPVADEPIPEDKPDEGGKLVQGVFVAVDPANGHILGLVGGGSYEESNFNRALLMKRHIGSLIKPFVYLSALINGRNPDGTPLNAISKFEDKPFTYEYDKKSWTPKNFEDTFEGTVTMRFALAKSINTVAAQVAIATGLDNVVTTAKNAGFEGDLQPLPSLSLGAFDAPPLDVARAYDTIANYGLRRELTATLAIVADDGHAIAKFTPKDERTLPPEETANVVQLMTSVFEIGTAHASRVEGFTWPAAGKTGTTSDFRDAWFAGFTHKILGISWVGFDRDDEVVRKHRKALSLTGAVAALPVWTEFMLGTHKNQDPIDLTYPDGALRRVDVDLITGAKVNQKCMGENVVQEYFTYRNAPTNECN